MRSLCLVFLLFTKLYSAAQDITSVLDYSMDAVPVNYGGSHELKRFFDCHLIYPELDLKNKKEGRVVIVFTVTAKGEVQNAKIVEHLSPAMNREAERLFKLLKWKPAVRKGSEVDYETSFIVPFKISAYKKALRKRGDVSKELKSMTCDSSNLIYDKVDKPARYLYGNDSLIKYLGSAFHYPESAKVNGIEGVVKVGFIVETNGHISNLIVEKSVGAGCNEEAMRLLGETKWKPAEMEGMRVRSKVVFPITFSLSNSFRDNATSEQK